MSTEHTAIGDVGHVEPKPGVARSDRGAAMLGSWIESNEAWGGDAQSALTGVLGDLLAAAEADRDVDFERALEAARRERG